MTMLNRASEKMLVAPAGILALSIAAILASNSAAAADFTIAAPSTTAQTLGPAAGQTGTVTASGTLTVNGSTNAVTISGNNASLTNLGTISQTGNGRVIRDNTGVTGLVVNNGSSTNSTALMQAADADVIQMNRSPASITLNNYGSMISLNGSAGGSQAIDFAAIASGANTINNFVTGLMQAAEADAVRPGVNGVVNNAGTIRATSTTGSSSDGVDLQNNSGVFVTNQSTGLIEGARHGVTGGPTANTAFATSVTNQLGGTIRGNNGSGVNLDGFSLLQTATLINNGFITGNGVTGDGDGIDADGLVNITNTGTIRSINAFSSTTPAQSEGITVGGGTIVNSGTIEGLVAAGNLNSFGRGITLAGIDTSGTPEPIYGHSAITNQAGGIIRGQNDSAIFVGGGASGFTVTINNNAGGTLVGGGATFAAIRSGANNDLINNAGTIDGSTSGKAIDMGGGNNVLNITGGAAAIAGNIDGGIGGSNAMTIEPGTGNFFAYAGAIANFNTVEIRSGTTTLSGASTYTGTTVISSGGKLVLNGDNRLATNSALSLSGGTLELLNASIPIGQSFTTLSLTDNSTLDLNLLTALSFNDVGAVVVGKSLTVLDWSSATSAYFAFRFLGDETANADFLRLVGATTINGLAAVFNFDGAYTNVSAVPLPGALVLLFSGLGFLATVGRRRGTAV